MELSSISEGLLCPGAILEENLVDAEVRIVDPELIHRLLIPFQYGLLQLIHLLEEVAALIDREILDDTQ